MTYKITEKCIACAKCLTHCPTGSIGKNDQGKFSINPLLCNDCVGSYGVAQCMAGCPTSQGCTPAIPGLINLASQTTDKYWDNWFTTYEYLILRLKAKKENPYWQNWFDLYAQKLDHLIHT